MSKEIIYPDASIVMLGHVDHGKTTLSKSLTGRWLDKHSEELKRGITIKLGYADFTIYKDPSKPEPECYTTNPLDKSKVEPIRKFSIVDAPGHEALITVMLTGAAIVDGAVLVIAANERCPQPQTREHLMAAKILGIKHLVVVQNKLDLVSKEEALKNYEEIKQFLSEYGYDNVPIIPMSALHEVNLEYFLEALVKFIPPAKRDLDKDPIFLISRSFDVNKPGTPVENLVGGVLGGSLTQGRMKVGDEIEIRPGLFIEGKWEPLYAKIEDLRQGGVKVDEIRPGGTAGIATSLDPSLTKNDALMGQMAGYPGKLPEQREEVSVEYELFDYAIGEKENVKVESIKKGETLLITAYNVFTTGIVTNVKKDSIELKLKKPILANEGDKVVIGRKIRNRWRIVGHGKVI